MFFYFKDAFIHSFTHTHTHTHRAKLTPTGLGAAERKELQVSRHAVPHLVGRGGNTIRQMEEIMGIILGVADGEEGEVCVSLFGPRERLDWAQKVVECVAKGARSLLRHLQATRLVFQNPGASD